MTKPKDKKIKLEKTFLFSHIKNLLIASYYMGQEAGLNGKKHNHPDCVKDRKNIIDILL